MKNLLWSMKAKSFLTCWMINEIWYTKLAVKSEIESLCKLYISIIGKICWKVMSIFWKTRFFKDKVIETSAVLLNKTAQTSSKKQKNIYFSMIRIVLKRRFHLSRSKIITTRHFMINFLFVIKFLLSGAYTRKTSRKKDSWLNIWWNIWSDWNQIALNALLTLNEITFISMYYNMSFGICKQIPDRHSICWKVSDLVVSYCRMMKINKVR